MVFLGNIFGLRRGFEVDVNQIPKDDDLALARLDGLGRKPAFQPSRGLDQRIAVYFTYFLQSSRTKIKERRLKS